MLKLMLHLFLVLVIFIRKSPLAVSTKNVATHDVILSTLKEHLRRHLSEHLLTSGLQFITAETFQ